MQHISFSLNRIEKKIEHLKVLQKAKQQRLELNKHKEWLNRDLNRSEKRMMDKYLYSQGYQSGDYYPAGDCYV